jgi:iron complex transport system substrate-binding protein
MKLLQPCALFFVALTLTGLSCQDRANQRAQPPAQNTQSSMAGSAIKYAHGFTIAYGSGYKEVKIVNHSSGTADTLDYLLLHEGAAIPSGHPHAQVIRIPLRSMIVMGSTHIAQADFAGVAGLIAGLGNGQYATCPLVREGLQKGRIKQVGIESNLNEEMVIAMHPGVMMTMTNPDDAFSRYKTLIDAGIPVLPNAEWLETTPLGKAEWVKLIGALTDREAFVNRKFDSVEKSYQRLAAIGSAATIKPSVIIAMPFKGTWYTPAGGSYLAQFLRDAGASYHWADSKGTGSLALSFETVAPEALHADDWLNVGYVNSKKDILAQDPRFGAFHSFQTGAIYNFNNRLNDLGSNDYWESGAVNPQIVLADLIRILHPDLLAKDTLVYYKQLK